MIGLVLGHLSTLSDQLFKMDKVQMGNKMDKVLSILFPMEEPVSFLDLVHLEIGTRTRTDKVHDLVHFFQESTGPHAVNVR